MELLIRDKIADMMHYSGGTFGGGDIAQQHELDKTTARTLVATMLGHTEGHSLCRS